MSPLRGPTSLQELPDSYNANTRRCLGCSFPTHERYQNKIDSNVDDLQLAFADLRKLAVIEEIPKRNNLNEKLARGPSTSVQYLHLDQPRQGPDLSSQSTKFHGSAPNVLKQPKTRQISALRRRRAVSAPQTLELLESGLSAKNTDIGNPSGPPRHVETGTADIDETITTSPLLPEFQSWGGLRPQLTTTIAREVFDVIKKPLSDIKQLDRGYVYTLRMIDRPGYVKIGRTIQPIQDMIQQISAYIPYELEDIKNGDTSTVLYHTRIEALVHAELKSYWRYFEYSSKQKTRGNSYPYLRFLPNASDDYEENDSMTQHGEWFKIDEKKACEAIERWSKWMSTMPYADGKLRSLQRAHVDRYANNQRRMEAMVIKDENGREHWDWTRYLDSLQWDLHRLRIHNFLFEERFVKSRSRWDSLKEYWLQNFAFVGVMCFIFPCVLSVASYFLRPVLSNTLVFAITNSVGVGIVAILYAA